MSYTIAHASTASGAVATNFPALWVFDVEGLIIIVFLTLPDFPDLRFFEDSAEG